MRKEVQCPVCSNLMQDGAQCSVCGWGKRFYSGGFVRDPTPSNSGPIGETLFTGASQAETTPKSAAQIVQKAADEIAQRGQLRDKSDGERSMKRTVDAFNGLLGRPALTEQEGWLFMCVLKMARATAGKHHLDDYTDLAGYAGLAGECGEMQAAANDSSEEVLQFNTHGKASNG